MGPGPCQLCDLVVVATPLCAPAPYLYDRCGDDAYFAQWVWRSGGWHVKSIAPVPVSTRVLQLTVCTFSCSPRSLGSSQGQQCFSFTEEEIEVGLGLWAFLGWMTGKSLIWGWTQALHIRDPSSCRGEGLATGHTWFLCDSSPVLSGEGWRQHRDPREEATIELSWIQRAWTGGDQEDSRTFQGTSLKLGLLAALSLEAQCSIDSWRLYCQAWKWTGTWF